MDKNNGFTLIELLSVVIVLALTFMFALPKMASLIKEGNNNEVRLIEQKALVSARKYINNYDTNFLNNFIEVGYTKTVYKEDLIDNGLMTLEEIEQIGDFRGVQVTLLENDKLEYTISRLSSTKDYTNEELLQMINELKDKNTELENNMNALSTQVSSSNIFLRSYPVGSIYISTSSTNPGSTYGGTWEEYGQGKTLVGVDSSDTDFNTVEKIGGEKTHIHTLNQGYAKIDIGSSGVYQGNTYSTFSGIGLFTASSMQYTGITETSRWGTSLGGNTDATNNLQPYITVYMWKRTA